MADPVELDEDGLTPYLELSTLPSFRAYCLLLTHEDDPPILLFWSWFHSRSRC